MTYFIFQLRVVAVKLKKRVTELTQTLEMERNKMATEKSDLQAKLTQLASNPKTVQVLTFYITTYFINT